MREFLPDPSSPYQLLLEASRSEDPLSSLEILKDSIRTRQQYGEVTVAQVQEYMDMEQWVQKEKENVQGELYYYRSSCGYTFNTTLAILYACFIFGIICCHLVYILYLDQELPETIRGVITGILMIWPYFAYLYSTVEAPRLGDWNPPYKESYNSTSVSQLKERQLKLIDCYLNQVLPMKAEIPASRYRHDVLAIIIAGEWIFFAFYQFCYSICHLSNNWSDKKIRDVDSVHVGISGAVFLIYSLWLISFWRSSKLGSSFANLSKQKMQLKTFVNF
ncbi:hypothetical protein CRE_11179 [Caenorhabditis remanei]|uniref:Uncharacterized protein n=1 Tax=Caenorhabditis remanei TaxID=31234 RepID=E3MQ77_CAERE|nr:hypothetical protein CRE_11179 [Caenorhabditis remanei]